MITNLTSGGSMEQIAYCVQAGAIKPLCEMLTVKDAKVITIVLDAVSNILQVNNCLSSCPYASYFINWCIVDCGHVYN